jgi:cell division protein FtsI/penicillin-binding protein 2
MKRSFLLYFLISVMGILFIGRLFQLQIVKSRNYNPVKNSAVKVMFDFPERGYIYDRNGELLVANQFLQFLAEKVNFTQIKGTKVCEEWLVHEIIVNAEIESMRSGLGWVFI